MSNLKVIISGGGTGGHIFPAISIAEGIKAQDKDAQILFVGATGKMEMEKVLAAGYEIIGIPARGLKRPLWSLSNINIMLDYLKCITKAKKIIKDFKPDVVVGVGGYASAAIVKAASEMKIPVILQEQNSFAGLVNKKNGSKASKICVAYDGMERFFPENKIILTGNPIRKDIKKDTGVLREEGYKFYNLDPNKKTIFVVGGSLGCRTLNNWMKKELKPNLPYQVIWQCGKIYKDEVANIMKDKKDLPIYWSDFIKRMDLAYAAADIVISRAGAGTISELCEVGKCTIFVPSPVVAEDHQTHNAMALVEKNAAILVKDFEAVEKLEDTIISLLDSPQKIKELETNISLLAKKDAAKEIASICIEAARTKNK